MGSGLGIECVVFDSSALLLMFTRGLRVVDQVISIVESPVIPMVPYPIVNELRKLSTLGRPRIRRAAENALEYVINNFSIVRVMGSPDDSVVEVTRRYGCIAVSSDMRLVRRLRGLNVRVIYLRASSGRLEADFR